MEAPREQAASAAGSARAGTARVRPVFWLFLLLLALAEVAARIWGPALPSCATERRNPYRFRGWPAYVAGTRDFRASNHVVVVLSNCQGYGAEVPGRVGFPAVLQNLLAEQAWQGAANWRVVNWSLDGATSIEYAILAAYLRTLHPDAVVASLAFADFRAEHYREGWRYPRSDVPCLATRWPVLRQLPRSYLRRHWKAEDALAAWAFDRLALLRLAEYGWSWLDGHLPGAHFTLYAPAINYRPWRIEGEARWLPGLRPVGVPRDRDLDLAYDERSTAMVDELVSVLAGGGAQVLVAAQPFRDRHESATRFAQDLEASAARHGVPFCNLQTAIPPEEFLTSNHLNRRGHRRLAAALADALAGRPPAGEGAGR